jgi:short-subunit dehydrogenase
MRLQFAGKNVLITGSSMGIGKGLSECFARDGANLALADHPREKDRLEGWARELEGTYGIKTWTFCVDLTEHDGPETLHKQVTGTLGDIHTLVNNAGICWFGTFNEMPLEKLQAMILLNCMAYTKLSRLFLPAMIERNEGGILNVSSVAAFQPAPTVALYAATKAFTQSLSEAIRGELPKGSRMVVSTLNPSFTRTRLIEDAGFPLDYIPMQISYMSIDEVTRQGFMAFKKGKDRYVPGLNNRILYFGLNNLPRGLINWLARVLTHRLSDFLPQPLVALLTRNTNSKENIS